MNKPLTSLVLACAVALPFTLAAQTTPTLAIQVDKPTGKVSPMLYGLMTEEINYSYDGGLYGELVRDRAPGNHWGSLTHWGVTLKGGSQAAMSLDEKVGPSAALPRSLKLEVAAASEKAPAGVENEGYWGMAVRPQTTYNGSFWAKTQAPEVAVSAALVNDQTGETMASAVVPGVGGAWKQYNFTLKTGNVAVSANNHLELTVTKPVTLWLDVVSLFPPTYLGRPGGNRIDLMEKMAAMNPRFLRLPGGNYLEGNHINERFEWKKTIGPWVDRPTHPSPWMYRSSDGMGLLEFLEWCEDLKIEPVLAVYAGYSLQQEHVEPGPELAPYVQDALDEIEYVTGCACSKWGGERAKGGHPAPFPLHYVEIGNEDQFDHSKSYDGRYAQFYRAIKEKYPELQLIATTPVKSIKPDVLDDHYYMSTEESLSKVHQYDNVDRNGPKIFVGEWATREGEPTPDLNAALGDAVWMTGMERNSDLIVMASYAPLLVNVNPGGMQWGTDLIGYDALTSYGSPSYYAQVMFGNHLGTEIVGATLTGAGPRVFASATRDEKLKKLVIKVVNASSDEVPLKIALGGVSSVAREAKLITLSGKSPRATNTIETPTAIVPVERAIKVAGPEFTHEFAPYSINVMEVIY